MDTPAEDGYMYTNLEYVCTKYPFKKVHCHEGICATYFVEYWYKCRKSCMMSDLQPGLVHTTENIIIVLYLLFLMGIIKQCQDFHVEILYASSD